MADDRTTEERSLAHRQTTAAYGAAYYQLNQERIRKHQRDYYQANADRILERHREIVRFRRHGTTKEAFAEMLAVQDGRCAICRRPMARICIDHDHRTGIIRGLLCDPCNVGLARFGDDPETVRRAADYLDG